jgi:hypothetical protein
MVVFRLHIFEGRFSATTAFVQLGALTGVQEAGRQEVQFAVAVLFKHNFEGRFSATVATFQLGEHAR